MEEMKRCGRALLVALSWLCAAGCDDGAANAHGQESPYTEQLESPIRSLSTQEIEDLREGRGMGLARAAELNRYPGPRHVLDLRARLQLEPATVRELDAIFARMQGEARALGAQVLEGEAALNDAFRTGRITPDALRTATQSLALLYAQLRAVHLNAHLETKALLTPAQVAKYDELRGYGAEQSHHHGS